MDLAGLRNLGDQYAENTVRDYFAGHPDQEKTAYLMDKLARTRDTIPEELPQPLQEYFKNTQAMPQWADSAKIKRAQKIFLRFGSQILLLLGSKALPLAYTVPAGAKILVTTGRLDSFGGNYDRLSRRLLETTQFVIDVLEPDGFSSTGRAIRSSQKVRLMHASIRYFVDQKGGWDTAKDGVPLNMKFELGTLLAFSALTLEGLESIKIKLCDEDRDAYMHAWNVIGYFLGIPEEVLPKNYDDGLKLGYEILDSEAEVSPDGKELAQALIGYYRNVLPGNIFNEIPEVLLRFFLGDKFSGYLGLDKKENFLDEILIGSMKDFFGIYDSLQKNEIIRHLIDKTSIAMLEGLVHTLNHNKGVYFDIPPSLTKNWKVRSKWKEYSILGPLFGWRLALQKLVN